MGKLCVCHGRPHGALYSYTFLLAFLINLNCTCIVKFHFKRFLLAWAKGLSYLESATLITSYFSWGIRNQLSYRCATF
jgi:hypothetical protein